MLRGTIAHHLSTLSDEVILRGLSRLLAAGALGPGCAVRRENATVLAEGDPGAWDELRLQIEAGRVAYELRLDGRERRRVGQAAVLGGLASAYLALAFGLLIDRALPLGLLVALLWAIGQLARDRRRLRRSLRALVSNLAFVVEGTE
jgi:hypothetical protein